MSRRDEGAGRTDVWRSPNLDGVYGEAENLGDPVNTEVSDFDPFVAPDESYLIVCQEFEGGFGKSDLYVYFQREDRSWTAGINLGEAVNSPDFEARPYVTPDGQFLFFTSNREESEGGAGIYWVDAKVIDQLRPKESE
jgi:Tol biopolymer transport system component